ncbi:MAG: PBSX family phage terminase large subunit [Patescibacteria group bacterium]|nr:PBSX family phage terminase large subunit [Patescibacteria group bacterium]
MTTLRIPIAPAFKPLLGSARYKGAWGGRGSGKSHFFAEQVIARCMRERLDVVCLREVQQTLDESVKKLLEDKIEQLGLGQFFQVQHNRILTPYGGRIIFMGMKDQNAHSIKSLQGFNIAWFEEAQAMSHRSLELLRPTIREPGSELWFSWNPDEEDDAIEQFLRGPELPYGAVVVKVNWRDNPRFPAELEKERQLDLKMFPKRYRHIWEGDYGQDGDPFFAEDWLLVDGQPVDYPARCDMVFAVIDTAVKDTLEHDGTAVIFLSKSRRETSPLTILDWDILQIKGALLEEWLPGVFMRLEDLAKATGARYGSSGAWIEDKASGSVLIQHAQNRGLQVEPISNELTMIGKEARAISASPYVYRGDIKISRFAWEKHITYRGQSKNHLVSQTCQYRMGTKAPHTMDLFDCFTYSVMLGVGNSEGF